MAARGEYVAFPDAPASGTHRTLPPIFSLDQEYRGLMDTQTQRVITPQVWGEDMWRCIHVVALGYPLSGADADETSRASYRAFYTCLRDVLPCSHCRDEYGQLLAAYDIDAALAGGKEALFQWTVDVHNAVARRLGKTEMTPLFVRRSYVFNDAMHGESGSGSKAGTVGNGGAGYMRLSSAVSAAVVAAVFAAALAYWWTRRPTGLSQSVKALSAKALKAN